MSSLPHLVSVRIEGFSASPEIFAALSARRQPSQLTVVAPGVREPTSCRLRAVVPSQACAGSLESLSLSGVSIATLESALGASSSSLRHLRVTLPCIGHRSLARLDVHLRRLETLIVERQRPGVPLMPFYAHPGDPTLPRDDVHSPSCFLDAVVRLIESAPQLERCLLYHAWTPYVLDHAQVQASVHKVMHALPSSARHALSVDASSVLKERLDFGASIIDQHMWLGILQAPPEAFAVTVPGDNMQCDRDEGVALLDNLEASVRPVILV